jgi:uncharacterized repeat protein (TIGR01451 family)
MEQKRLKLLVPALALAVVALLATPLAHAVGTPAGTSIDNTATVTFEDASANSFSQPSNMVSTTVNQVAAVDISPATDSSNADPGDDACYLHTVSNLGNDTDIIDLTTNSSLGWTVVLYEDLGIAGTFEAGIDTALIDNGGSADVDTGALPDSVSAPGNNTIDIWVCVSVPGGTANGVFDDTTVTGTSDNDNTQTDAAVDTTTVDAPALTINKAVDLANADPGDTLTYTVTITNNGAGDALNVVLRDPIPANTTYVAASITQDAAARTDVLDMPGDNADYDDSNANEVTVFIGTLASGGGSTVIEFQVTVN